MATVIASVTILFTLTGCEADKGQQSSESYNLGYSEGLQLANPANGLRAGGADLACTNMLSFDLVSTPNLDEFDYLTGCKDGWAETEADLGL